MSKLNCWSWACSTSSNPRTAVNGSARWLQPQSTGSQLRRPCPNTAGSGRSGQWLELESGLISIGIEPSNPEFHFDNETPRQTVWLDACALAARLVTNAEFEAFIADGGYQQPQLWMAEGWSLVQEHGWAAPRYWREDGMEFSLRGLQPRQAEAPVRHLSWFEGDAMPAGARGYQPKRNGNKQRGNGLMRRIGLDSLWQWTASPYTPYRGFKPAAELLANTTANS